MKKAIKWILILLFSMISFEVFATTWKLDTYYPNGEVGIDTWAQTSPPKVSPIIFDGIGYLASGHGGYVTYDLTMIIQGTNITGFRTNASNGINCTFTGIISDNKTQAQGQMACDHNFPIIPWTATIYNNLSSLQKK